MDELTLTTTAQMLLRDLESRQRMANGSAEIQRSEAGQRYDRGRAYAYGQAANLVRQYFGTLLPMIAAASATEGE